jgi:hypothetical protein
LRERERERSIIKSNQLNMYICIYMYYSLRPCSQSWEERKVVLVIYEGILARKRPLGRPRRRWEDNIKMDLLEIGWGSVDWIGLAQDKDKWRALVNAVMNLRAP